MASSWPDKFDAQIYKASRSYLPGVDWRLYKAQLIAESDLRVDVVSPVGASGIAQFMPGTWADVSRDLALSGSPFDPQVAIPAGAFYMAKLRGGWRWRRPERDKHNLALASYNAGFGHVLAAQRLCGDAVLYADIVRCLPMVTGRHAVETRNYVARINDFFLVLVR
ncbi:transglycosylase SLT domain-containing protein [Pseudoalteromonas tunicata]|uniref:transglycosylase SLT domain-containing protein n=1 Tax=Pseudoalteromonas tunicata TaxID=314281 RepID=UPI00273DBC2E|nr:transglycosylase SLT domain-containing protein [Pseudoalteromonas tunicata]MDP5211966.1 transglycosylase SLT domain-containing protein [Pseudoalteromonas tunicata]